MRYAARDHYPTVAQATGGRPMSTDPTARTGRAGRRPGAGTAERGADGDRPRAAYEAELSRITSADMILQAAVSLLNLGGRRLGLAPGAEGERDLEQVRDAVDGVRALLGILERSASRRSCGPCATRCRSCRWPMRARRRPAAGPSRARSSRPPGSSAPAAGGSLRCAGERRSAGYAAGAGQARRRAGRVERQAVGAGTLRQRWRPGGRHDRLRAPFRR